MGMMANICEFLGNPRFGEIPESTILIRSLISNAIVLEHLQDNLKMASHFFSLVWNAAVDASSYTSKQGLLEVALILAEILQDPDLNHQTLINLSYLNLRNDKMDLASKYAEEAQPFDRSQSFKLVLIEIMLENLEIEIESTKAFVDSTFDLNILSDKRSIYLICMSLERQNYLMAGILLDSALSACMNKDEASDVPGLVPIMLQNFFALALNTKHPFLMGKMFNWMNKCNAGIVDISNGGLCTTVCHFLCNTLLDTRWIIVSKCLQEDEIICFRRYLAHQAFTVACIEFRDGSYSNTVTAAHFASTLLDHSLIHEMTFQFLLASQVCLLIAIYSLFRLQEGIKAAGSLIASLKERSCRILKSCPEESRDKLQRFLYYEKYMVCLFTHWS